MTLNPLVTDTQLQIAGYSLHPLPTGLFALDGGAMFGTVPKVLWEKTNPADEHNRIQMEARALLVKSKERVILIDTGNGHDFVEKYGEKLGTSFSKMYGVDSAGPTLLKSLQQYGVQVSDVTDVILTHLHFDHAGGATCVQGGKIVPTFPKATYYIQERNWQTAHQPNRRERASYLSANFLPLKENHQLKLISGPTKDFLPGISLFVSDGHTQGHQCVVIEDAVLRLIYCGDVIPTSSHIRSAWVMGYDLNPLLVMQEKNDLLQFSKGKKTYYFFEHDPFCDMATVAFEKDDFKIEQRFHLR